MLGNRRIVITRARGQADGLAEGIRAFGGTPCFFPTIALKPLVDFRALDAALSRWREFDWVVFTSANGVRFVSARGEALGLELCEGDVPRVAAIGSATERALNARGLRAEYVPGKFLSAEIARELPVRAGERVLLLRADIASDELSNALVARGAVVTDGDAYRTVRAKPPPLDWERVDAVTFTSASTVENFAAMVGNWKSLDIFCIGPVTAQKARELGMRVTATAREHTSAGLVKAMCDFYGKREYNAARITSNHTV